MGLGYFSLVWIPGRGTNDRFDAFVDIIFQERLHLFIVIKSPTAL